MSLKLEDKIIEVFNIYLHQGGAMDLPHLCSIIGNHPKRTSNVKESVEKNDKMFVYSDISLLDIEA